MSAEDKFEVLVPTSDHQYCTMSVQKGKAVWNEKFGTWYEYLGNGDQIKEVLIVW